MKYDDVETQEDLIEYYEGLLDFLDDNVACLDELITIYNEGQDD